MRDVPALRIAQRRVVLIPSGTRKSKLGVYQNVRAVGYWADVINCWYSMVEEGWGLIARVIQWGKQWAVGQAFLKICASANETGPTVSNCWTSDSNALWKVKPCKCNGVSKLGQNQSKPKVKEKPMGRFHVQHADKNHAWHSPDHWEIGGRIRSGFS